MSNENPRPSNPGETARKSNPDEAAHTSKSGGSVHTPHPGGKDRTRNPGGTARAWHRAGLAIGLVAAVILVMLPAPTPSQPAAPALSDDALIRPLTLSDWILGGEEEYFLIDVRDENAFVEDAIKTAVSMPSSTLDDATIGSLPRNRRIVVYADDQAIAAEAWQRIAPYRERTYVLDGGMSAWKEHVLNPQEPAADASLDEWNQYRRHIAVANYYLGKTDAVPVERRRVVTPVLRPRPAVRSEGC